MDRRLQFQRHGIPPSTGYKSDSLIPSILLVCRESFGVASKAYTRSFGSLGALPEIYFNFKLDTLYLDHKSSFSLCQIDPEAMIFPSITEGDLAKVEHLALHNEIIAPMRDPQEMILCLLVARFSKTVKTLTVVMERHKKEPFAKGKENHSSQELALIDTVNIRRRWYMFEHPKFHVEHIRNPDRIPDMEYWVKFPTPNLDVARDYYEAKLGFKLGSFTMPIIEYKFLTTSKIKTELDRLQREYERVCSCRCYENESAVITRERYDELEAEGWPDIDDDDL